MAPDLAQIWAGLIAFAVLAYVVLDGFDLGVGILFPALGDERRRDVAMTSIAPVWDGNETWLVLGGGGLMAAFPLAYATVLSALYIPITAMLLGLVFRGVAVEFRWRTTRGRWIWDISFAAGSTIAAFAQGVALGALVAGIEMSGRAYEGGPWDWVGPFPLLTGAALVVGYSLLGATWLAAKTTGALAARARGVAAWSAVLTFGLIGAVSLITPFLNPVYFDRWFRWPGVVLSLIVPGLLAVCAVVIARSLRRGGGWAAFFASIGVFALCFAGLGVSFHPYIVPPALTIEAAAAPDESLGFLLVGAAVLIPVILGYTAYAYYVFRGKVTEAGGH